MNNQKVFWVEPLEYVFRNEKIECILHRIEPLYKAPEQIIHVRRMLPNELTFDDAIEMLRNTTECSCLYEENCAICCSGMLADWLESERERILKEKKEEKE